MGTESIILVKRKNKIKLAKIHYWDGYPAYMGAKILNFLRKVNIEEFSNKIDNLVEIDEEIDSDFILEDIMKGVQGVVNHLRYVFYKQNKYLIDLDNGIYVVDGTLSFNLKDLPTEKDFRAMLPPGG